MESSLPVELVPNLNRIAHGIELELELMQKNHENPSPDSNPSLELIQPYEICITFVLLLVMLNVLPSNCCMSFV